MGCFFTASIFFIGCGTNNKKDNKSENNSLFYLLPASQTGIHFNDSLTEGLNTNVLMYEYFYNGGGVAVGDINNDGLDDIYFTGNMVDNRLYLNKGNMKFEDITSTAGVAGRPGPWKTGTTMVDINGDNLLDIYVSYSGKTSGAKRIPQLFINKGNTNKGIPVFTEEAKAYGLTDSTYSTQAYFFDYDKDGDLDMLQANHNPKRLENIDDARIKALLGQKDAQAGTRLLKNDNGHFKDVTATTGIQNTVLSYNLGAGITDINKDGWPDIYLSNDYFVPDYLYINNKNGTFSDKLEATVGHTSQFSMGNDIADINNDALPDIVTLDMLPEDNHRQKLLFAPDNYEEFDMLLRAGFHHQYMRNMLQLNNGNGSFSEIGQLAGIATTDWSWAPLIADYDNDGWKDLFVTNGYVRDYTNMDFLKYMTDYLQRKTGQVYRQDLFDLVEKIPASNVVNYIFKNNGNTSFTNMQKPWGFTIPSNSNGAAYADLDNDGDLDLIINNINQPAFIYQNNSKQQDSSSYLKIKLAGSGKNTQGIGAKVILNVKDQKQYLEQMPARGFQSSVSPVLQFGLGKARQIDSLVITWPDGKQQVVKNIPANQTLTLKQADATMTMPAKNNNALSFFSTIPSPINYQPAFNPINDFKRQPLLINPLSFSGPCIAKADINNDKLEDLFIGGGSGKAGAIYLQQKNGGFILNSQNTFEPDRLCEDADAAFFDADGNGTIDLYVASGGYHNYWPNDSLLKDRLYLNDGKGNFTKAADALPVLYVSSSCVRAADVNGDGYTDVFVGGRTIPGRYPETPESYLLINNGKGKFVNSIATLAPSLQKIGMVTDAAFVDLNKDNIKDLVVVGEWMPVTIFINRNGKFEDRTNNYLDKKYSGWWNRLCVGDYNGDGHADLIIGNTGLNTQCKVSPERPAQLFYKDYDDNGAIDPIFCFYMQNKSYPYVTRDELLDQLSIMRTRFTDYKSYADAGYKDIFKEEERKDAKELMTNCLETVYFESQPDGKYAKKALPLEAQYAPVYTITNLDYDKDGDIDLLLCGNINHGRLRLGNSDANYGILLQNNGKGVFSYVNQFSSGLQLRGDIRSVVQIKNILLFGINQQPLKAYKFN